jgi:hypothetical protein
MISLNFKDALKHYTYTKVLEGYAMHFRPAKVEKRGMLQCLYRVLG